MQVSLFKSKGTTSVIKNLRFDLMKYDAQKEKQISFLEFPRNIFKDSKKKKLSNLKLK